MIDNLSMAVHALGRRILTSLSIDETLLPRYVKLSTNFRGSLLRVDMAPSCLNNSILLAFTWRPIPPAACFRLLSRDSASASVFARSIISSARQL